MAIGLLILLVAVAVVVQIVLEVRTARRAGMSEATPVCANCHYPLGGWSSPRCPECGQDVQAIGVRPGPHVRRIGLRVLVVVCSIFVVGPMSWSVFGWVFDAKESHWDRRFVSLSIDRLTVHFFSEYSWRRFPPTTTLQTTLVISRFVESRQIEVRNGLDVQPG